MTKERVPQDVWTQDASTIAPAAQGRSKKQWRLALLNARAALTADTRAAAQAAMADALLAWLDPQRPACLGIYLPIRGEPDLSAAWAPLQARGWTLALPVVHTPGAPLRYRAWDGHAPLTARDAVGLAAPAGTATEVQPTIWLLPSVGLTAAGYRLGYGGGYFDRSLAPAEDASRARPATVGVAFNDHVIAFEPDPCDQPVDWLLTEAGLRPRTP